MITRISKIARLPKNIREQLNTRLQNGQMGRTVVDWLNDLPETKEAMAKYFAGNTITHQNLSEWRRTGYQDWLLQQQRLDWFGNLTEQDQEIIHYNRCPDSFEAMGSFFLFELGQAMTAMQHIRNPDARWTRLQNLTREFARLQNAYNWSRRVMLEWDKFNSPRNSGNRKDFPRPTPQNSAPRNHHDQPAAPATKPEPPPAPAAQLPTREPVLPMNVGQASCLSPYSSDPITGSTRESIQANHLTPRAATEDAHQNSAVPAASGSASSTEADPPVSAPPNSHPDNALQAIPTPSTTTPPPPPYNPPLPQIHHQPPPPPAPKPYRPFSNPIRGRRFTAIEG